MLTNGKKIWGIKNQDTNTWLMGQNGEVYQFDDFNIAKAQCDASNLYLDPIGPPYIVSVITEGSIGSGGGGYDATIKIIAEEARREYGGGCRSYAS